MILRVLCMMGIGLVRGFRADLFFFLSFLILVLLYKTISRHNFPMFILLIR
jgi:hypothetical protein